MIDLSVPKKTKIILIFFIIIIIIITFITFSTKKGSLPVLPTVSPAPTPIITRSDAGVDQIQQKVKQNQYPLIDYTPYETQDFAISYVGPLHLKITLWGEDKSVASQSALIWIKSKGVDPQSHQIDWE